MMFVTGSKLDTSLASLINSWENEATERVIFKVEEKKSVLYKTNEISVTLMNVRKLHCRTAGISGWVCDYNFLYILHVDQLYLVM